MLFLKTTCCPVLTPPMTQRQAKMPGSGGEGTGRTQVSRYRLGSASWQVHQEEEPLRPAQLPQVRRPGGQEPGSGDRWAHPQPLWNLKTAPNKVSYASPVPTPCGQSSAHRPPPNRGHSVSSSCTGCSPHPRCHLLRAASPTHSLFPGFLVYRPVLTLSRHLIRPHIQRKG